MNTPPVSYSTRWIEQSLLDGKIMSTKPKLIDILGWTAESIFRFKSQFRRDKVASAL
jgi:hypothetical protein